MMKKINDTRGQTALILILLTAAALIFLAITINWGHIAQTKALVSVAADQGATFLASGTASYGEMQKQTYLNDTNQVVAHTSVLEAIIMVIAAIVALIITIVTYGAGFEISAFIWTMVIASLAMSVLNLVLQVVVVQPGITSMWNKMQKNQPVQQQLFEGGLGAALQGAVTDQGSMTDFLDSNANGVFGLSAAGFPTDSISRFGFFYSDRLRMLNQSPIPQVVFFYNQLGEFINGETCAQNQQDNYNFGLPVNAGCQALDVLPFTNTSPGTPCNSLICSTSGINCNDVPTNAACQVKIPNNFQLNDSCGDSNPALSSYNPYCDPCCLPLKDALGRPLRPLPPYCTTDVSAFGAPAQCWNNNPFNNGGPNSLYTLLYDPTYQEYGNQLSFLDQFGRDQPMGPFPGSLPAQPQGNFPNGIYPFFYLTGDYSLEVDNINLAGGLTPPQAHWCTSSAAPGYNAPTGYSTLAQLSVPGCAGQDCCVNFLGNAANGVIDMVGSPTFPYAAPYYNPAFDPRFSENSISANSITASSWLAGDNQMCSATWPYNGAVNPALEPDGTCEWTGTTTAPAQPPPPVSAVPGTTIDALDETMHTLSDFVIFSYGILGNDVGTLSASFDNWYPEAADWIDPASNGRLLNIYNPANGVDLLNQWNNIITNWLNVTYANDGAWCVPTQNNPILYAMGNLLNPTVEEQYISNPGNSGNGSWGDLPHVIACLNYNAGANPVQNLVNGSYAAPAPMANTGSLYNYQQCLGWLKTPSGANSPCCKDNSSCGGGGNPPNTCKDASQCKFSSLTGTLCDPAILGRSLLPVPVPAFDGCAGSYKNWVNNNINAINNEAPKFALRSAFLADIYNRAQKMQLIFNQGDTALHNFLAPCSGPNCSSGGPAAQLTYAYNQDASGNSAVSRLPNAVIYGWQDPKPNGSGGCTASNGQRVGCSHIVKVVAYSTGRNGNGAPGSVLTLLPWIKTKTSGFLSTTRSYTLTDRDGAVYVDVRRWDEDHNPISFPNGHTLWQSMFHNPASGDASSGSDVASECLGLNGGTIGFGLQQATVNGLKFSNYTTSPRDVAALGGAFMLNDEGNGRVDTYGVTSNKAGYCGCLNWANAMLSSGGQESRACVQYVASINASGSSGNGDHDYSLKFVDCNSMAQFPPDDLKGC